MSLFVRIDVGFWQHRKTLRLRALIGDAALWVPPRLWCYAAQNQPNGDFSEYLPEELAMLLGYSGNALSMLEALQQARFMDGMTIHDWKEHNGYHETFAARAKTAANARWEKDRKRKEKRGQEKRGEEASNASSIPHTNGKKPKASGYIVPECFELVAGFSTALAGWIEQRNKIRKAPTGHAVQLIINKLSERPADAVAGLNLATEKAWTGFEWKWFDNNKTDLFRNGTHQPGDSARNCGHNAGVADSYANRPKRSPQGESPATGS